MGLLVNWWAGVHFKGGKLSLALASCYQVFQFQEKLEVWILHEISQFLMRATQK